jgi:hypothetical protein
MKDKCGNCKEQWETLPEYLSSRKLTTRERERR